VAEEKVRKAHEISMPSEYVFGKGVLLEPFSITLWENQFDAKGEPEKNEAKQNLPQAITVQKYQTRLSKEQFADEQARRTITFRIDLEGMPLSEILNREATETTLRKQYRNNVWSATAAPTLEDVEAMIKRAGSSRKVTVNWRECQPKASPKQDLSAKSEDKLQKELEAMQRKMAAYEAELKSRKS